MERRNKLIALKVTPNELIAVDILSKREGVTRSEFLRLTFREGIEKRGIYAIGLTDLLGIEEVKNEQ